MANPEILPDLFFVHRGFLNGNHFVYRADRPVLIDTAYLTHFDRTRQLIADLGVDLARTTLIVNTHTHCDHIGGNRRIQELSGCGFALHKIGQHFIEAADDWSTWWRYYDQEAEFFRCTRSLEDGETLAIGPHEFRVIHTPGHAADGIVLYHAREKVLISADALLMRPGRENATFFGQLMKTVWFPETCAFFFNGEHRRKYDEVMAGLIHRRIVTCMGGKLFTHVAA